MTPQPDPPPDQPPRTTLPVPAEGPPLPALDLPRREPLAPVAGEKAGIRSLPRPRPHENGSEEVDVWWGGYSSWAMLPSWLVCVLLTMVIVVLSRLLLARSEALITVLGLTGALWLGQLTRWLYRLFSFNYRLTNRRLYVSRGFLYPGLLRINLTQVRSVAVRRSNASYLTGVGDIVLEVEGQPAVTLQGVFDPRTVARVVEATREGARLEEKEAR